MLQTLALAAFLLLGPVLFVLAALGVVTWRVIETVRKSRASSIAAHLAVLAALLFVPAFAFCGESHQETEFDLPATAAAVRAFVEKHPEKVYGRVEPCTRGLRQGEIELRREVDDQVFDMVLAQEHYFWADGTAVFRARLSRVVAGPVRDQQGLLRIVPNPDGGAHVSIASFADVDGFAPVKIAVELRRNLRAVRRLLEKQFPPEATKE
jgi:hypothetical protein